MEATFFGNKERSLYGIYQPPITSTPRNIAVLLCYPLFQEYLRSHRSFCQLSIQLAKAGCHVFRFDYSSTGDSYGELDSANVKQWGSDIKQAAEELKELSGVKNISVVGLRMGATLALDCGIDNIKNLILWDPVISGKKYLNTLDQMHKKLLVSPEHFPNPRKDEVVSGIKELLGFPVPNSILNDINRITITPESITNVKNINLITSFEDSDVERLVKESLAKNLNINYQKIASVGNWDDLNNIEETLMPNDILNSISELLTR